MERAANASRATWLRKENTKTDTRKIILRWENTYKWMKRGFYDGLLL